MKVCFTLQLYTKQDLTMPNDDWNHLDVESERIRLQVIHSNIKRLFHQLRDNHCAKTIIIHE